MPIGLTEAEAIEAANWALGAEIDLVFKRFGEPTYSNFLFTRQGETHWNYFFGTRLGFRVMDGKVIGFSWASRIYKGEH